VSRNLEDLWSEDPPRSHSRAAGRSPLNNLWDEQGAQVDVAGPAPGAVPETDVGRIWERKGPPPLPLRSNGRRKTHPASPTEEGHRQGLRPARIALQACALFVVLVLADAVWAGLTLRDGLQAAETGLQQGVAALQAGDLEAARDHFAEAREGAGSARSGFKHPATVLGSALPGMTRDVGVLRSLSSAGELASESGLTAVELASELGLTSEGFASSLYSEGRVDLDALERGEPYLAEIAQQLDEAETLLAEAPEATFGLIDDAHATALGEIAGAGETARKSSELFGALPTLLGQDGKQRYFLAFQALSEARGTGGLIGLFGILSADDGEIALKKVGPIADLIEIPTPPSSGPPWYETRYAPFGALVEWQQTNFSPNLPVVSEVLLERFEAAKEKPLDGVVMMDPIALGMLSNGTGPLQAEGLDVAITENNARKVLLESIYEEFGRNTQNTYLADLITEFWGRIQQGNVNANRLIAGMGEAASTRHLTMYSSDVEAQEALVETDVDGGYNSYGPNVQMIFNNNLAANKLDFFMDRSINTKVVVDDSGDALVTTAVQVHNEAPSSGSALLNSGIPSDPPGLNRLFLNAMLPKDAQVRRLTVDGQLRPEVPDDEDGFPTVWDVVELESGQSSTMKVTYVMEDAFTDANFALTMIPQTAAQPDSFSLEVQAPDGFRVSITGPDPSNSGSTSVNGVLDAVRTFAIDLEEQ
jgi:hypothetical protein